MEGFLRYPQLVQTFGVCRREIERWIAEDKFPKPIKAGRVALFAVSEIEAVIERLKQTRKL